ncbi:4-amino-4-deoxychorismate lyase [Clostridium novyi B str. ATCC 27606]|uniref:4-amino-4-deoxychorismate lyase n=2 Tax=Clostridium TaxID=1485 RepID=A0AA40IUA3_CLONO|nr:MULTISPECIES: aminotransferase class IV [Clostridium]KEI14638.1 4-amino-4-deoxychorismate lyase [Clostridium novyi B str. NCTC 9691]KEI16632.1 4-amino-4-deoxychorismate lyase [Clostridium novyi B str. ATCC 27606]KEI18469.1 4-amino-4-deoxychorismate lyase [Clostridium haemolyticum NCTC 9693]KGN04814.1 4-amino-4-deoxychorismate lyase [Clostridium haemolyticum NCTC 8350]OOB76724.1 4-amino-4-deoxychorismate lyase [Clostridium haemolyticum]
MCVSINGKIIDSENFFMNVEAQGFNYGYGIFETLKIVNGKIFFMEEHFQRFVKGCNKLNMDLNYNKNQIEKFSNELIFLKHSFSGAVKILYIKNNDKFDLIITTKENTYTKEMYDVGFKICFACSKRNPYAKLTYIKSNNYLENILEKDSAVKKGYNEAIFLNTEHHISEGTYTNIFFIKNNSLYTPDISCGLLPGIMREKVIALVNKLSLKLEINNFNRKDLINADEVFLTNSLMEIMPVSKLENKRYDLNNNKITQLLRSEFYKVYYL